jgi:hypothetical protein
MEQQTAQRRTLVNAGLCILAILILYPLGTLIAGYFHSRAVSVVKSSQAGEGIAEEVDVSLRRYEDAIRSMERASAIEPYSPDHRTAVAGLLLRFGKWMQVLESMDIQLSENAPRSTALFLKAEVALQEAVSLEPTNADLHFMLAVLHDAVNPLSGRAEKELDRAIIVYPVNSSLRYAIAIQHLMNGRPGQALEQATVLAKLAGGAGAAMNRPHLFSAFEIAWRATKDMQVVQGICPDEPKALKVLDEYLKWKGSGRK